MRIVAVANSPDLLALHRAHPERYPYLLQSSLTNRSLGRHDILFAFPGEQLVQRPGDSTVFLDQLDTRINAFRKSTHSSPGLPFCGGWFLFLSYELAGEIERLPALATATDQPIAMATRIPAAVIHDRESKQTWLMVEPDRVDGDQLLKRMQMDIEQLGPFATSPIAVKSMLEDSPEAYLQAIAIAKNYIRDGDIFQANLSRQWSAVLEDGINPADIYDRLRRSNPSPFGGLARLDNNTSIISSSPERLLEVRDNRIRTRPIAGTYPRLENEDDDARQARELLAHPKERAEHIMLIDLERNDLGRVCRPGTVKVPEFMVLESYRHVHHIVSEVCGELRPGVRPSEVIAATFPGGTITGCPKVRCMEIINELEQGARGAYTGSFGYINHDGSMDLNILIRTMTLSGNRLSFRAGAGIVADSDPDRELAETRAKAEGMIRALGATP